MIAQPSSHVRSAICALVIAILILGRLEGQSPSKSQSSAASATVLGYVRDAHGVPVPGAAVWLQSEKGESKLAARTDADGRYTFAAVPPGVYTPVSYTHLTLPTTERV